MIRSRRVLAAAMVAMTAACGADEPGPATAVEPLRSGTPAPVETGPDGVVTYRVARFQFPALTVAPGAKIRIVDGDSEPHTVTAVDGSFDSGSFGPDSPATLTAPTKPGTYKITARSIRAWKARSSSSSRAQMPSIAWSDGRGAAVLPWLPYWQLTDERLREAFARTGLDVTPSYVAVASLRKRSRCRSAAR